MGRLRWLYAQTRNGAPRSTRYMEALISDFKLNMPKHTTLVTGTNGKGTIAHALGHAMHTAGLRTGVFTSPHVEEFNERIRTNGRYIETADLEAYIDWLQENEGVLARTVASFFELTLVIALKEFAAQEVTHAVIEAGVGVRHDATNAMRKLDLSIISNVSVDHANVLGSTVAEIAADKAYALRPGMHTVTGATGEALAVIQARADALGSHLHVLDDTNPLFAAPIDVPPEVRLAAAAARLLELPGEAVNAVFAAPPLPARRERFAFFGNRTIILDGAHNIAAAERLVAEVPKPYTLLFGVQPKKDAMGLFNVLSRHANDVFFTKADPHGEPFQLPEYHYDHEPLRIIDNFKDTVPEGATIVIAGSFYLAGRVRSYLRYIEQHLEDF